MKKRVTVIGGGVGGYTLATRIGDSNYQLTLIEEKEIGGTCLNVGCIPTKALLDSISLFEHFSSLSMKKSLFFGTDIRINPEGLRAFQIEIIRQLKEGLEKLLRNKNIKITYGKARLQTEKKILVQTQDGEHLVDSDEIVIATGSSPKGIETFNFDKKLIVSSDDIWNIPVVPQKLLIIGSGPVGVEFARIFQTLGTQVTVVEIKETICPILDLEISENLARSLKRRGVILKPNTSSSLLSKEKGSLRVKLVDLPSGQSETSEYDQVLVAVGRKPNTEGLGLESAGIELEKNGFVKVNQYLQTNKKNIWAIGDVTNYPQLAHTASFQARVVAGNILGRQKAFSGDLIPSCIFGYPEVAFVGLTEEAIKARRIPYKKGTALFLASGKAKAASLTEGVVKVLIDESSRRILGAHIIGPEASNLIHELVVAMQNKLTVSQVVESIHAHPTYSEVVLEALEGCLSNS